MAVNTDTAAQAVADKVASEAPSADSKGLVYLGKAVEALKGTISDAEQTSAIAAIDAEEASAIAAVQAQETASLAAVNSAAFDAFAESRLLFG